MNDFRSLIRNSVLDILGIFSRPQNGIHILNGHMICRGVANDQAKYYFSYQLKELSRHVRFIRVEEATSLILNHESVDEPLVAFTFDDGFMECHSMIAPVLEQFGVNAAFFINPNFANGDDVYIQNFYK